LTDHVSPMQISTLVIHHDLSNALWPQDQTTHVDCEWIYYVKFCWGFCLQS